MVMIPIIFHVRNTLFKSRRRECSLLIGCVVHGASFRLVSRIVQLGPDESDLSFYGGCNDLMASDYTRVACAACLLILSDDFGKFAWIFNRIRLHCTACLISIYALALLSMEFVQFHLLALPLCARHTSELMLEAILIFMDALYPQWRETLVGMSTDGDRSMTGRIQGLVARVSKVTSTNLIRVWCGLHQLYIVMQRVFKNALGDDFYSTLTAAISQLRRKQNLATTMHSMCPKVADTRWVSMDSVATWLVSNIIAVLDNIDKEIKLHSGENFIVVSDVIASVC
jgi:hypothetical protein